MVTTPDPLDVRDALRRTDPEILAPGEDQRFLVTRSGAVAVQEREDGALHLALERHDPRNGRAIALVHLGMREGLRVTGVEMPETSAQLDDPGRDLRDLRRAFTRLEPADQALAMAAVAIGAWHRATVHCPRCGHLLEASDGGWVLRCPEDGIQHFPRTDPAVIMSLVDERERLLLAHNARAPQGFHSVLAGFVEPGESAEDAVAREVHEEVGLQIDQIRYVDSQSWPFPRSLMLGFTARVAADAPVPRLLDGELGGARWVRREELADLCTSGEMILPGPMSLGHQLIRRWYGGELPGAPA